MKGFAAVAILVAAFAVAPAAFADGKTDFEAMCTACHGFGIAGAPRLRVAKDWIPRLEKGREAIYANATNGFAGEVGVMPPKGGFAGLSDDRVRRIVDYMLENSGVMSVRTIVCRLRCDLINP